MSALNSSPVIPRVDINSQLHSLPYIALHIWLQNSIPIADFPVNLFSEWVRMVPVLAQQVQIEAGCNDAFVPLKLVQTSLLELENFPRQILKSLRLKMR